MGGPVCRPYGGYRSYPIPVGPDTGRPLEGSLRFQSPPHPPRMCSSPSPKGEGLRAADSRPYDGSGCGHFFFVGAGHWPARRCTRRVQEAVPYSPAPAAACSAKAGAAVETHQRKFLRTQGPVARKEFRLSLRFPRAGNFAELLRRDSRKTGSGVRRIWARQCPS